MHRPLILVVLLMLGCAPPTTTCASGTALDPTGRCLSLDGSVAVDTGTGTDAAMLDAHVACGGACSGATHVCDIAHDTCVGCLHDADCSGSTTHCEPTSHTCVACLTPADCMTAATARCDTTSHACAVCTTNADCAHLTGLGVCNMGTCVACTPADESACGANSCNPTTHACTTTPRMSIATCRACIADSECMSPMNRCVPMQFMGAPHGSFCLRQASASCVRPYTAPTSMRASASGAALAVYCGVDETLTTCEAVQALVNDTPCTMASDCGAPTLADGLCQTVNFVANRCTYSCSVSGQCPSALNCGAAMYCGSP